MSVTGRSLLVAVSVSAASQIRCAVSESRLLRVVTRRWRAIIDNNGNFAYGTTRVASLVRRYDRDRCIPTLLGRAKGTLDDRIGLRTRLSHGKGLLYLLTAISRALESTL